MPSEIQRKPQHINWTTVIVMGLLVLGAVGFSYTQAIRVGNIAEQEKNTQAAELQKMQIEQQNKIGLDKAATAQQTALENAPVQVDSNKNGSSQKNAVVANTLGNTVKKTQAEQKPKMTTQIVPMRLKTSDEVAAVIPPIVPNQISTNPVQPPAPTSPPIDLTYCNNLRSEWTAFSKDALPLDSSNSHLLGAINEVLDAYKVSLPYAYQTAVARRDSFYAQADASVKLTEEIPTVSFERVKSEDVGQKFYLSAQEYKDAYDLMTEAFKQGSYGGNGIQTMKDLLTQTSDKVTAANDNGNVAGKDAMDIANSYAALATANKCP